jgi:hypothetical protein
MGPITTTAGGSMSQTPLEPEPHEHTERYDDVPGVDDLEPDFDADETDEVDEVVEDEDA